MHSPKPLSLSNCGLRDVHFTPKGDAVDALPIGWPEDGRAVVQLLARDSPNCNRRIRRVELLGVGGPLRFARAARGLNVNPPKARVGNHAFGLTISLA
jgi:alpha-L-fucosidase